MQWECAAWNFLSTGIFIFLKKSKFLNKKLSKKKKIYQKPIIMILLFQLLLGGKQTIFLKYSWKAFGIFFLFV